MHLSHLNYAIWIVGELLAFLVCALAYRRRLYRRLPFFTAYMTALAAESVVLWTVYRAFGYGSWAAYDVAWTSNAILLTGRGLIIGELCFRLLREYRGIWALAWRILLAVSSLFVLNAAIESISQPYWLDTFVLTLDRDLELAAAGVLIALLLIGRYYQLDLDPLERRIAAGLFVWSITIVITNAVMVHAVATHLPGWNGYHAWIQQTQSLWTAARILPSVSVLGVWAVTLAQPVPAARPAPVLLPASAYRELSPAVNMGLRAFNARLLEFLKP